MGVVGCEQLAEEFVHGEGAAVHVEGLSVVHWTNLLKDLASDVSLVEWPLVGRAVQNVVYFYSLAMFLQLLAQHDVLLRLIGKEQNQFSLVLLHFGDLD